MKGNVILWTLLLALAMTACGQNMEVPQEERLPEPEIQEAEQYEESLRESRRIMSEEALEYTNREENSNGFVLTEREEEGVPFLEFTRPDVPDFFLRINRDLTEAAAEYQGRTMTLERVETPNGAFYDWYVSAGYGGLVSGYSMPFWADLTGDGLPELAWLRHGYGTGFHESVCTVYNISGEGEIIPLAEPWEEMAASVTVELRSWEDGYIPCLVTDGGGADLYGLAASFGGNLAGVPLSSRKKWMELPGDRPGEGDAGGRHDVWTGGAGYVWHIHGRAAYGAQL